MLPEVTRNVGWYKDARGSIVKKTFAIFIASKLNGLFGFTGRLAVEMPKKSQGFLCAVSSGRGWMGTKMSPNSAFTLLCALGLQWLFLWTDFAFSFHTH